MSVLSSAQVTLTWSAGILATVRYYQLAAPTAATPTVPTSSGALGSWSETEPAADVTKVLWTCERTVYADGTESWSKASKSTSYEAAKDAKSTANAAKDAADGAQQAADSASDAASDAATAASKARQAAYEAQRQATQTAETLAQAQEYLDGIRQWVSDGQSFLGFQDVGEATAQLTIANRDSSFYTTLTNTRQEYHNGSSTIMAIDGQHGRVEASALAVGKYEWQSTNNGANMTLVYIGG